MQGFTCSGRQDSCYGIRGEREGYPRKVEASPFLVEFIGAVKKGCSLERAAEIFRKYNKNAVITAPDDEFDLLAYFPDGEPDGCRYCLQDDLGGITYHRFTKLDYDALYPHKKSGDNTEK